MSDAEENAVLPRPTPRGEARRRAFLDAAQVVFFEQGFGAASVNDVVRRAGGSLATLYAQFGNKEGLFLAMLEDGVERLLEPLTAIAASHAPIRDGLQQVGELFLERIMAPETAALFRIVLGEAHAYPHVFEQYLQRGPEKVRAVLKTYLRERQELGEIGAVDLDWAASFFLEMVRARHHMIAMYQPGYKLSAEEVRAHVARAVNFFLSGAAPR